MKKASIRGDEKGGVVCSSVVPQNKQRIEAGRGGFHEVFLVDPAFIDYFGDMSHQSRPPFLPPEYLIPDCLITPS